MKFEIGDIVSYGSGNYENHNRAILIADIIDGKYIVTNLENITELNLSKIMNTEKDTIRITEEVAQLHDETVKEVIVFDIMTEDEANLYWKMTDIGVLSHFFIKSHNIISKHWKCENL